MNLPCINKVTTTTTTTTTTIFISAYDNYRQESKDTRNEIQVSVKHT